MCIRDRDVDEPWDDEARRYFIGIVGKYGVQVQNLLKVAATLDIQTICPLHGPVLNENLGHYIGLYDTWSSYTPEEDGIVIAYTSVYGHTKAAFSLLADELRSKGCPKVVVYDLARDDMSQACLLYTSKPRRPFSRSARQSRGHIVQLDIITHFVRNHV